jgi:hypothetical protein
MVVAGLLICEVAHAQFLINPARVNQSAANFDPRPDEVRMKCDVFPVRPSLNFSFRFQAGYRVQIPLASYAGSSHSFVQFMRITPAGGAPSYLTIQMRLPKVPPTKAIGDYGGTYYLGEGKYHVDFEMLDETGHICRKSWNVETKRRSDEKSVKIAMPPGAVADLALRGAPRRIPKDDAAPFRLTVLLHAGPAMPRRTRLTPRDRSMLLGTLSAMLERVPARSVRLVAFNLDQQRELYRKEDFSLTNLSDVAQAIDEMQLGTVDVRVLQNKKGHADFTAQLLSKEMAEPNASDVIVILGPPSRFFDKAPKEVLTAAGEPGPRLVFLQQMPMLQMGAMLADTIGGAVSKLRGKTFTVRTPGEFAKAIAQVERRAAPAN